MFAEAIIGSMFSTNPIVVKRLMALRSRPLVKEDQDSLTWSNRVAKSIVKALVKYKLLEEFELIVSSKSANKCVSLSRFAESTLIANDHCVLGTGLTAICKLWRWPDLVTYFELNAINSCSFPIFSENLENVCINPFHYDKIQLPDPYVYVPLSNPSNSTSHENDVKIKYDLLSDSVNNEQNQSCPQDVKENKSLYMNDEDHLCNPPSYNALMLNQYESHEPPIYDLKGLAAISYVKPPFWCSISYYELNQRVGAIFHASQNSLTVDGFTDPSCPDRFCLGSLSNISRNSESESCRKRIGRGVRLYYISGEVYVECLSDSPVFAQSISSNKKEGWHPATVCKIPSGCNLKIFNNQQFAEMLANTVSQGFEAVYQLTALCTIRISFVKGWGSDYKRQTITSTPCWIEIHLNGPLQWLDRVMACLQPPGTLSTN